MKTYQIKPRHELKPGQEKLFSETANTTDRYESGSEKIFYDALLSAIAVYWALAYLPI